MNSLVQRFLDLVLSVYLYNEWRGYSQMEEELIPLLEGDPRIEPEFLAAIKKHCADEKKHYNMFKGYFISRGRMPFAVGKSIGYFDALTQALQIDKSNQVLDERNFAKLCRAIVTTEHRGIHQVATMLKWRSIRGDERLRNIFQVIEKDEPSHFIPYAEWLEKKGYPGPTRLEKLMDLIVHYSIAIFVIPSHFFNFRLRRLDAFAV